MQSVCYFRRILTKLEISPNILINAPLILNSTEIFTAGAELFRDDRRTDMLEKSIITFQDCFTDTP